MHTHIHTYTYTHTNNTPRTHACTHTHTHTHTQTNTMTYTWYQLGSCRLQSKVTPSQCCGCLPCACAAGRPFSLLHCAHRMHHPVWPDLKVDTSGHCTRLILLWSNFNTNWVFSSKAAWLTTGHFPQKQLHYQLGILLKNSLVTNWCSLQKQSHYQLGILINSFITNRIFAQKTTTSLPTGHSLQKQLHYQKHLQLVFSKTTSLPTGVLIEQLLPAGVLLKNDFVTYPCSLQTQLYYITYQCSPQKQLHY